MSKKKEKKEEIHKIEVKVVGVGGGASSVIEDIANGNDNTHFYIADTDTTVLDKYSRKRKIETFSFGKGVTKGMGTGMNVDMGRKAALASKEDIKEKVEGADLTIFVSCLGGGTGSGAMPVFARAARETGSLTYGVFTLPFDFERERKLETARKSLSRLREVMDAMTVIPNQKIFDVVNEKTPIKEALSEINEVLGSNLEGLMDMIYSPGLINIDFADLETTLKTGNSLTYLTRARGLGDGRVKDVLRSIIDNPLYSYSFGEAEGILFNIEAPQNLSLAEVSDISDLISKEVDTDKARIIFGVNLVRGKNDLDLTLLAVGCEMESLFWSGELEMPEEPGKERKNALEVQKDAQNEEREILEEEEKWDAPAFLRDDD